jgi:hypothetical protein
MSATIFPVARICFAALPGRVNNNQTWAQPLAGPNTILARFVLGTIRGAVSVINGCSI